MNILFSLTYYSPYISGLTIIAKRLAEKLALKHNVSILCSQHDPSLATKERINNTLVFRAKPTVKISKGFLSFDWILKSWKLVKENSILIVCLPQPEAVFTVFFAFLLRKKIVSLYLAEVKLRGNFLTNIIELVIDITNFINLYFSSKIVTYSKEYAEYAPALKTFLFKTECIYPPIPRLSINLEKLKNLKSIVDGEQVIKIGIQARLAEDKGFEYLFDTIPFIEKELNKKAMIIIAGPMDPVGEDRYKAKIMNTIHKIKSSLIFLGNLDQSEMGAFYKSIDLLVYPSILESFGLGQVEAMMLGIPVVSTNLPGASVPILRTGMGELVPPKNPELLAKAIIKVIKNKKAYIHTEIAISEFDINKVMEKYEKLLLWDDHKQ